MAKHFFLCELSDIKRCSTKKRVKALLTRKRKAHFPYFYIRSSNLNKKGLKFLYDIIISLFSQKIIKPTYSYLLNTKGGPIPWPGSVATSPAVPGRRIGQTNGLDLTFPDHFAKKLSNFIEINPWSNFLSQEFLRKNPQSFSKSTRSPIIRVKENLQRKP